MASTIWDYDVGPGFKFLNTADWHCGLVRYSRDVDGIPGRHLEFLNTIKYIVDYAIEYKLGAVFITGDISHVNQPSQLFYADLIPELSRLGEANIPTYLMSGNHDAINTIPGMNALRTIFKAGISGLRVINEAYLEDHGDVELLFVPHINRCEYSVFSLEAENKLILEKIQALYPNNTISHKPKLVFGHATIQNCVVGSERLIMRGGEQTFNVAVPHAIAYFFGHIHKPQELKYQDIPVYYPGSIQAIDFGERNDEKSFICATLGAANALSLVRPAVPTRGLKQIEYDLEQYNKALEASEVENVQDLILKIVLHIKPEEKKFIDEDKLRSRFVSAYWIEFDYDFERTTATRSKDVTVDADSDQALKLWYSAKKHDEKNYDSILNKHRKVMAEATTLKE